MRSVTSGTNFCNCNNNGNANTNGASNSNGVRPIARLLHKGHVAGAEKAGKESRTYPVKENEKTAIYPVTTADISTRLLNFMNYELETICNADNLYAAYNRAKQGTDWKESVQRYGIDVLANIYKTQQLIRGGAYKTKPMVEFLLYERGRIRRIQSQHISDRVVQRSLNDYVLIPRFAPQLIYDNGASLKGKGPDFARRRFRVHLQKAYKEYDGKGYILFIDFSKYFDNIRHEEALKQFGRRLSPAELDFVRRIFKEFEIDVSYMTQEEYAGCMESIFNATKYKKPKRGGGRFMRKCVGIGNQISQVTGILYPHRIDNYCKIVEGLKYYGRYMDDSYIMLNDKERLKEIYKNIKEQCAELGIFINEKKTRIVRLTDWNCFLKINHKILPSGKVIRKVHNSTIRRCRRRFRKHRRLMEKGRMSRTEIQSAYKSWRGVYRKYHSGYKILKLDKLFKKLFTEGESYGRTHNMGNLQRNAAG